MLSRGRESRCDIVDISQRTYRPVEPTLGESGGSSDGKSRESDVVIRFLQDCSIRLCRLRTEGLISVSKY
jgi:hypothetical protein